MPIFKLVEERGSFDPEEVAVLCNVLDDVMQTLGVLEVEDPIIETVAKKIVEIAKTGVSDPASLKALTLQAFSQEQQQQQPIKRAL